MANLIKQKFLEGIDSSKFKIEQGGAIKAVNSSGQLVEVFKFDAVNEVVKVFGDEEVAVSSYVDSLMAQEVIDRNSAINQAITDLINGAPQALDTLKELADALGNDGDAIASLISQLAQEVTDREADVNAEESRAMLVEQGLNTRLTQAESDIDSLESRMSTAESDINSEESRAMLVEQGLNTRLTQAESDIDSLESRMSTAESDINSEESRAMLVEQGLNTRLTQAESDVDSLESRMSTAESDINSEESRAMLVEQGLNTRLTQAESDVDSLESRMSTAESDIDAEESRAMLVEQGLNTRVTQAESDIDSLESRMSTAESDIDAEESARQLADQGLQSQIDTEKGRVDAILLAADANKDSFAEIVTLINSIDASNDESLAGHLVATVDAHDASAISFVNTTSGMTATSVQGALDELQSQVDQEESNRQAADAAIISDLEDLDGYAQEIRSDLDQEILDRQADVDAEEARAMAAESALQDAIDAEAVARAADVDAEEARAIAAETQLQSNIDAVDNARALKESELEAEDLTFFKHDGSRPMTGDLKMMVDSSGLSNKIKWDYQQGNEQINSSITYGMFQFNYSNIMDGVYQSEGFGLSSSGQQLMSYKNNTFVDNALTERGWNRNTYYLPTEIQMSESLLEVVDPITGEVTDQSTKTISYGINGINAQQAFNVSTHALTFNTGDVLFTAGYGSKVRFRMPNDVIYDSFGEPILDSNGNTTQYCPRELEITEDKNIKIWERGQIDGVEVLQGYTELNAGNLSVYGKNVAGQDVYSAISATEITSPRVRLKDDYNNVIFVPTEPEHATTKEYVDNSIVASTPVFDRARIEINTSSKLEKVVLGSDAPDELTILVFVNRLALHLNQDYSISNENGDYVLTWMGDFATGGTEAVELGDVVYVTYVKQN